MDRCRSSLNAILCKRDALVWLLGQLWHGLLISPFGNKDYSKKTTIAACILSGLKVSSSPSCYAPKADR